MSEATDTFWAKKKERQTLSGQIDAQVNAMLNIAHQFSDYRARNASGEPWQWIRINGGGNIPSHVMASPLEFSVKDWPDIRNLAKMISEWHSLDWDYRQAWVRMTDQEKEQLAAHKPESHIGPTGY
jgi:hypothetical protein